MIVHLWYSPAPKICMSICHSNVNFEPKRLSIPIQVRHTTARETGKQGNSPLNDQEQQFQYRNGERRASTQVDYAHRHNQVANTVHKELGIKYGLSDRKPVPYYK